MAEPNVTNAGTESAATSQASTQSDVATTQAAKALTEADLKSQVSAAVNEAQRKWKEQLDATVADKTRDADAKLAELTSKAEEAERYASFIEAATTAGVRNVKAAYAVAKHAGDYINKAGVFDTKKFRADNPEFFAPAPNANAGAGAGAATNAGGMNAFIRSAAGRG